MPDSIVKIVMTGHGRGEIFIDGIKVPNTLGFAIESMAGETNKLSLQLLPARIEVEGPFKIGLNYDT
jgi:hypothetical protein